MQLSELESLDDTLLSKNILVEIKNEKQKLSLKLEKQKRSEKDAIKYRLSEFDEKFLEADDDKLATETLKRSLKNMLKLVEVEYLISLEKKQENKAHNERNTITNISKK
jgi:hypothetical protein